MAFVRPRARIGERSTTSGGSPWSLGGAFDASYSTFASFMSDGDTTWGSIVEPAVAMATGVLTYHSSGNTVSLSDVEETKGTFGTGTKEIFAGPLAHDTMLREDISGAIVTGGTSTAYTVATFRKYDTLAHLDGNIVAFTPHATNGIGGVTLNADGLGNKPLRTSPGTELLQGVLIQGTPYLALYNNTDGAWYLSFFGNPLMVPLGCSLNGYLSAVPNSYFAEPNGQAIDRTTYANFFAIVTAIFGSLTHFGSGNGSSTANLPDEQGCVEAMREASASRLSASFFGDSTTQGVIGGLDHAALSASLIPNITSSATNSISVTGPAGHTVVSDPVVASNGYAVGALQAPWISGALSSSLGFSGSNSISVTTLGTGGSSPSHGNVQPTIIKRRVLRVL